MFFRVHSQHYLVDASGVLELGVDSLSPEEEP
jgi:hypothetical protein